MRFLCLHGAGTSAEIFEIQSGGITQALEDDGHEFVYVDGRVDAEPDPELMGAGIPPFFNHYRRDRAPGEQLTEAIKWATDVIAKKGSFDAVMGFSQGAALAASLIVNHARSHDQPLFKAAVFICGARPYDPANGLDFVAASNEKYPITIPTTHIVGKEDHVLPQSMQLHAACDPAQVEFYDHGSRHLIPFDLKNTEAMISAIKKTIERAS
ncbi:serine hydrolase FSH [Aspergillus ambiguus]|uniref:alpha/beta hydrolase n=1 Tax=Aspergillus ambiguus TaxID=176160 RepID=UPI003CCDD20B